MTSNKPPIYLVSQGKVNQAPWHKPAYYDEPPPLGLLYIGQALKNAGYRVRIIHLHGKGDRSLERAVKEERPLFVGFSNFICPTLKYDIELSRWTHQQGIPVVWGGVFSTSLPEVPLRSGIVDYVVTPPRLLEQGLVGYTKSYELEPFLSGEYQIPAMKVSFGKPEEEKRHELESETLTVQVSSLLPEEAAELAIEEIMPPVAFPRPPHRWLYALIAAAILGAAGFFGYTRWRKRRATTETIVGPPAHEIAFAQLEDLIQAKLIEMGEVKLFYLRLSNTLRHYIENRFTLRAPERTTEEFLADLRDNDVLIQSHKDLLKEFLQHCDLVKFAEHLPSTGEIEQAFDACKRFILETQAPASRSNRVHGR